MFIPIVQSPRHAQERRVEADGFFNGAHDVPVESGLEELDAQCEKKSAELKQDTIESQKRLEARIEHIAAVLPECEQLWDAVRERTGDRMPPVAMPTIIAFVGILALYAEALLLAPAMDLLNVTRRAEQLVTAFGLAGLSALVYHFCWLTFTSERMPRIWKLACRALGVLLTAGLIAWGILRGLQVAYAAKLAENPLGDFLNRHPTLSAVFFVLVSLGAPVVAAAAAHFAADELHLFWEWVRTRSRVHALRREHATVKKQLEGAQESLNHGLRALSEDRKQSRAVYQQHWTRGRIHGAVQEPYWTVIMRATIVALVYTILFGWAAFIYPLSALIIPLFWFIAFLYFRRQWQSPGPISYFDLERVRFAEKARDAEAAHERPRGFGTFGKREE